MSVFLCDKEVFEAVLSTVAYLRSSTGPYWLSDLKPALQRSKGRYKLVEKPAPDDPEYLRLGMDMYRCNMQAAGGKFDKLVAAEARDFRVRPLSITSTQAFKLFECLDYQCMQTELGVHPARLLIHEMKTSLAMFIVRDSHSYRDAPWSSVTHDIYVATCLHPGVIADDIALRHSKRADFTALSDQLEKKVVRLYAASAEFRDKLAATGINSHASNDEAKAARDWLWLQMEQWVDELPESEQIT